mgnify:CR=1 FL=1
MRKPAVTAPPPSGAPSVLRRVLLPGQLMLHSLQPLSFVAGQILVGLLPLVQMLGLDEVLLRTRAQRPERADDPGSRLLDRAPAP